MPDKPLTPAELALLELLQRLATEGPVTREKLSIAAKGRGLDFATLLGRLRSAGLIKEVTRRPFWLRRLFGAKPLTVLIPQQGSADMAAVAETLADLQPPPLVVPPVTTPLAAPPVTDPPAADPPVIPPENAPAESPISEDPEPEAPTAGPPAPEAAAPDTTIPAQEPKPPVAPVELSGPKAGLAPAAPKPVAEPRPKLPPVTAFTEDLGGAPLASTAAAVAVDPETVEGVRSLLESLGMELTIAGESLLGADLAGGKSPGEALLRIVIFAFAHAVRFDLDSEGQVQALGLSDYAAETLSELGKLHEAGEIPDTIWLDNRALLQEIVSDTAGRAEQIARILADPMGGAAPPALLPEDLRLAGIEGFDEEDSF